MLYRFRCNQHIFLYVADTKEYITTRGVLWYLVFFGFAVNYMLRINLNIAIVSMIKVRPDNSRALTSECLEKAKAEVAHNKTLISSTSNRVSNIKFCLPSV